MQFRYFKQAYRLHATLVKYSLFNYLDVIKPEATKTTGLNFKRRENTDNFACLKKRDHFTHNPLL